MTVKIGRASLYPGRAIGNRAPKPPYSLNKAIPQARGIGYWGAIDKGAPLGALRDFSGFGRDPDVTSSPNTVKVIDSIIGKTGIDYDISGHKVCWGSGNYGWQLVQKFTLLVRFYFTADITALTNMYLWDVGGRVGMGFGLFNDFGGSANDFMGGWFDGSFQNITLSSAFDSSDINILHEGVFSFEDEDQRLYLDGVKVASDTLSSTINHASTRSASVGGGTWNANRGSPPMVAVHALWSERAWKDSEVWDSWNHRRWEIYDQPDSLNFLPAVAAVVGAIRPSSLTLMGVE